MYLSFYIGIANASVKGGGRRHSVNTGKTGLAGRTKRAKDAWMSAKSPSKCRTPPTRATLIIMTAFSVLTLNLFLPSLPSMAAEFGVSYGAISFSIAAYLYLFAVLAIVLGPLADRYGRRPILLCTFSIFTPSRVGTSLGSIAMGFFVGSFIAGRVSERSPLGLMMIWGRRVAMIGPICALALVFMNLETPVVFFALLASLGLGNGISLPSANTGAMSVRPDLAGSASGLSAAIATAMGAIASAATGAVLTPTNSAWLFCLLLLLVCICALVFAHIAARSLKEAA